MDSKRYNNIKLAAGISEGIVTFILILAFVWAGLSLRLENLISGSYSNNYLVFILFVLISGFALGVLFFSLKLLQGLLP